MEVITAMSFKDCYKNIIESFCDWSTVFGSGAKLIDECTDSNDEDVTVYSLNPYTTDT